MVRLLRQKVEQSGLENIECVLGGFSPDQTEGPPADFIVSRHALHHLPDFWKAVALQRMARRSAAGGILPPPRPRLFLLGRGSRRSLWHLAGITPHPANNMAGRAKSLKTHIREELSTFAGSSNRCSNRQDSRSRNPSTLRHGSFRRTRGVREGTRESRGCRFAQGVKAARGRLRGLMGCQRTGDRFPLRTPFSMGQQAIAPFHVIAFTLPAVSPAMNWRESSR